MNISAAGLQALFTKIYRFVNGNENEIVKLDDGRELQTMAGLNANTAQRANLLQLVTNYTDYDVALSDALSGYLQAGDVVKVHNDTRSPLNGFHQVTKQANLKQIDGYELFDFFPTTGEVRKESTGSEHTVFETRIDTPLIGQTLSCQFSLNLFMRGKDGQYHSSKGEVIYGIDSDQKPFMIHSSNYGDNIRLVLSAELYDEYYIFKFIANCTDELFVPINNFSTVNSIFQPSSY